LNFVDFDYRGNLLSVSRTAEFIRCGFTIYTYIEDHKKVFPLPLLHRTPIRINIVMGLFVHPPFALFCLEDLAVEVCERTGISY